MKWPRFLTDDRDAVPRQRQSDESDDRDLVQGLQGIQGDQGSQLRPVESRTKSDQSP